MADQLLLLSLYRRDDLLVTGTAAAPLERWQGRERPKLAIPEIPPQSLDPANAGRLPAQMARGIVKGAGTTPARDSVAQAREARAARREINMANSSSAPLRALEPRATDARHWLVPHDRNADSADPKIARADGGQAQTRDRAD